MKKIIAIILIIGCTLSLVSCGEDEGKIELTLDNFSDYFEISIYCRETGYDEIASDTFGYNVYSQFELRANVLGASSQFAYHDVTLEIEVKVMAMSAFENIEEQIITLSVDTNVAGNGSKTHHGYFNSSYIVEGAVRNLYEVTSVRGYVKQG